MITYKRWLQDHMLVIALAALALLLNCSAHAESQDRRIVSLGPALTEMLFALGLDQQVVGVTTYCNYPAAAAAKPKIGDALHLNEERVIALHPDLIVAIEGDRTRLDRIGKLTGARVQVLRTRHVNDIWANFRKLGALTGKASEAVVNAFREAARRQGVISNLNAQVAALAKERQDIEADQTRIRQNMSTGTIDRQSDLFTRYVKKLNDQETRLEAIAEASAKTRDDLSKAQADLNDYLANLSVE